MKKLVSMFAICLMLVGSGVGVLANDNISVYSPFQDHELNTRKEFKSGGFGYIWFYSKAQYDLGTGNVTFRSRDAGAVNKNGSVNTYSERSIYVENGVIKVPWSYTCKVNGVVVESGIELHSH